MSKPLHHYSLSELQNLLQQQTFSAQELVEHLLQKIAKQDEQIKSFLLLNHEQILEQAREADERIAKGQARPLEGIPIAVKDNICVAGEVTSCASKMLADFQPCYNATAVSKLKEAGAIIFGKTNLDEFAMGSSCENSAFFPTHNPWDRTRSPGGSSGGSAAAVAAGFAPVALGSDTGGSVRQPASLCGLVGLKPTYGRVSRFGLVAFGSSLDQIGTMSRSVDDAALLLETISGVDPYDATSARERVPSFSQELQEEVNGLTLGFSPQLLEGCDSQISRNVEESLRNWEQLGITIKEIKLKQLDNSLPAYYIIANAEACANLARYDGIRYGYSYWKEHPQLKPSSLEELYTKNRTHGFGPEVQRRILLGTYALARGYYEAFYLKALQIRTLIIQELAEIFQEVDAILTPTSPIAAFKLQEKTQDPLAMYLCDIYTASFSLSGNPAISLPSGMTSENLPIGLQIVGSLFAEKKILALAKAYEKNFYQVQIAKNYH